MSRHPHAALLLAILGAACADSPVAGLSEVELGERLFHDTRLSKNRTQSCATCHDESRGFVDSRAASDGQVRPTSLGDDGVSIGERNAPSAAYALLSPNFVEGERSRHNTDGDFARYTGFLGGQFLDGRADDLKAQAAGPFLNPLEMNMPSEAAVVKRLQQDAEYVAAFERVYGADIFDDTAAAYDAMTDAIAAFEQTERFAPFDSRYDRSLLSTDDARRYAYDPASPAAYGKSLFFSAEFTNCAACHQLNALGSAGARREPFSGFEYHNLGVPENEALRAESGADIDEGLGGVLEVESEDGKFKTPSLRNVAVTAPYMHNGVFRELATVLRFYEHAKLRARNEADDSRNPESNALWRRPEVPRNISDVELGSGNKDLTDARNVAALECFLMSLTDARYEALLDPAAVAACGL